MIHLPAEIRRQRVVNGCGHGRFRRRDVMLVAVLADEPQQLLEVWHLDYPVTAKRIELVFSEPPFANVGCHLPGQIISRDTAISERPRTDPAHDGPVSVFLADSAGDDFLVIHLLLSEKSLRQVRTVK